MSFVAGEQCFIDSLRNALPLLEKRQAAGMHAEQANALREQVRDFCAQEATHRHVHNQFNAVLAQQGLKNHLEARIYKRFERTKGFNPMHPLAVTVAYEHYTAVLAQAMLAHPLLTQSMEPAVRNIWRWHALEETEHKAVAFDLYTALGGNTAWRRRWFTYASIMFAIDNVRQTTNNLWHDGTLFKPSTWLSAVRFFFGRPSQGHGWFWLTVRPLVQFFKASFHPWQHNNQADAQAYATEHAAHWRLVR